MRWGRGWSALALLAALQSAPAPQPAERPADALDVEFVDRAIEQRAAKAGVVPVPLAGDAEFLRRVTLDVAGVVPTPAEVDAFLADARTDKRARRIDELVASDRCAARLAQFLVDLTIDPRATTLWFANVFEYREWLAESLRAGQGYDQIVREILTAVGQTNTNGATNFAMFHRARADRMTAGLAKSFLGASLECAECHDHRARPFTREQFWGVAAFFSRTNAYFVSNGETGITDVRFGRLTMPPRDKPEFVDFMLPADVDSVAMQPRWLDGTPAASEHDLRGQLATFLVHDPAFARNLVNRVWQRLFGRALAEPVDDVGGDCAQPEVLDALARDFAAHGHDLRRLLRLVARSRAYQRSSCGDAVGDERLFVRALPRSLDLPQWAATIEQAAGLDLVALASPSAKPATVERPPTRTELPNIAKKMAILAPDPTSQHHPFDPAEFARLERYAAEGKVATILGGTPGTIGHALVLHNLLDGVGARVAAAAVHDFGEPIGASHVAWIWRALLSRSPTIEENEEALALLTRPDTKPSRSLADVAWAVLNSDEFGHNH